MKSHISLSEARADVCNSQEDLYEEQRYKKVNFKTSKYANITEVNSSKYR